MTENKKKIYLNKGQLLLRAFAPNSKTIIAARRFGKSDGVLGPDTVRDIQYMPRSSGAFYQANFKQLLGRTLPATLDFFNRLGLKKDVHFFVGRKAPKWMNFAEPLTKPIDWEHVIHFYNGSIIHLLSQDVKFSANSLTLDWLKADEARSIKLEKFSTEVIPAVSGAPGHFLDCPWRKGVTLVSDKPTSTQGLWLLKHEDIMNEPDNLNIKLLVEHLLYKRNKLLKNFDFDISHNDYASRKYASLTKEINFFRRKLFMYFEFDTIENIEIVGSEYIAEQKRLLPPVIFQISIMNNLIRKLKHGFYTNLIPSVHYYQDSNVSMLDNQRTDKGTLDIDKLSRHTCLFDNDLDNSIPLCISCDYNANINWIVTGQVRNNILYTVSSFFSKHEQKLRAVLRYWAEYYSEFKTKEVVFYYDSTALASAYADEYTECFADIVYSELSAKGWLVNMINIGNPWKHNLKHQYINDALTGIKYLLPLFNMTNNEFLLPAMEQCGIKIGRNGFEKDKSGEKLAETDDNVLEMRTDGTDAWDTLFIGCNFFPYQSSAIANANTVLK